MHLTIIRFPVSLPQNTIPMMPVRNIGWLVLFMLAMSAASAQNSTHTLLVQDAVSGEPLIGATAEVSSGFQGVTGVDGTVLLNYAIGDTVLVQYLGYDTGTFIFVEGAEPPTRLLLTEKTTLLQAATVTSSRYEKPLAESTVSIDILTTEFFERNGAIELEDGLNRMPGIQIIDGQANIRGGAGWSYGAGSRVMLLMDDMPILQVDAAIANWDDLPLENIASVEILKGAASALYGTSALNGVIHFRTNYAKAEPETEVSIQGTLFDMPDDSTDYRTAYSSNISLVHRRKMGKWDLVLGGFYRNEESFRQGSHFKLGRASTQIRYRFSDRLIAGVNGFVTPASSRSYFFWDTANSFRGTESGFSDNNRLRYTIDPYVKYDIGAWSHKIQGRFYHVTNDNEMEQSNSANMYYGEYQTRYRLAESGTSLAAGAVHHRTESSSELYSDTTFQNLNTALYFQADQKLAERWTLSAGVRWERNDLRSPEVIFGDTIPDGQTVESKPIFRFGVNYQAGRATYLRGSWGQGYRFPSIAEKFINTSAGGLDIKPNPGLESETGWTAELGVRQGFLGQGWNGFIDLSVFRSEYDNMMEFSATRTTGLPFFRSQNVGGVRIDGVEVNGFFQWKNKSWSLDGQWGYTHINPRFIDWDSAGIGQPIVGDDLTLAEKNAANSTGQDDILKYRNRNNFKFDVQLGYGHFFTGLNVNRTSPMEAVDRVLAIVIPGLEEDGEYDLSGSPSTLFDVRVGMKWKTMTVQMIAKNITDERYWARPGYLEAPRNYTIRMDYSF